MPLVLQTDPAPPFPPGQVYLGVYFWADYSVFSDQMANFENAVGKKHAIYHYYTNWYMQGSTGTADFNIHRYYLDLIADHGSTPMLTWMSIPGTGGLGCGDPKWNLDSILNGSHDAYIRQFAQGVAGYKHTLFLRWGHEMNLPDYSWSGPCNGNNPSKFIAAYRHIHDLFVQQGATNVQWIWSPNYQSYPVVSWNETDNYYPGDAYVDWIGVVGYNWGASSSNNNFRWLTWSDLFGNTLTTMTTRHPSKPLMIADYASVESDGGSKATWIAQAFSAMGQWPNLHAVVWYNGLPAELPPVDQFKITSSPSSVQAYRNAIAPSKFRSDAPYP